jgi:hypothetical protein
LDALDRQRFDEAVPASRFERVAEHDQRQVARPVGFAVLLELLPVRRDVVRANFAELVLSFGHRLGLQGHPLDCLAVGVVFDGDPGDEAPVAPPQATNCVLAAIKGLGVSVSA